MRMGIIWGDLIENDITLSEDNIRGQRNFSNKIWNVARFVLSHNQGKRVKGQESKRAIKPRAKGEDDRWILDELKLTTKKVTKSLDKYRLNEAAEELYDFVWNRFASTYLESSKVRRDEAQPILEYVLAQSLKLLHPFMPFVTEKIWSTSFSKNKSDLLINAPWPIN